MRRRLTVKPPDRWRSVLAALGGPERILVELGVGIVRRFDSARGEQVEAECPLCGREAGHFYVAVENGAWICHAGSCGRSGSIVGLVEDATGLSRAEVEAWLVDLAGLEREELDGDVIRGRLERMTEDDVSARRRPPKPVPRDALPLSGASLDYVLDRGVSHDVAKAARLSYVGSGRYGGRIVIPLVDVDGRPGGWVARTIRGDEPKYLYAPGSPIGRTLFCPMPSPGEVVLVEGPFDALAWASRGVGACAVLGARLSSAQAGAVVARWPVVSVAFDPDEAGESGAEAAVSKLAGRAREVRIVSIPAGSDPADVDPFDVLPGRRVDREGWTYSIDVFEGANE